MASAKTRAPAGARRVVATLAVRRAKMNVRRPKLAHGPHKSHVPAGRADAVIKPSPFVRDERKG